MSNDLLNRPMTQQTQNNLNFTNMTDEQAKIEAQRQMMSNPNLAQRFQQVMQQNRGKPYWAIADELARQRGIDLNQILGPRR